ncbi:hypothetical protein FB45DRAFT_945234 [Roridomyces roridus]|uniref:Secreted protein n=1 Tax=Roridomyces roridus TaxID=1738132 RepID=A0AAD7B3V3_9AGAR|nr:hypothetical protein FB45DRAFT_945234 [Roridomyces roridus]
MSSGWHWRCCTCVLGTTIVPSSADSVMPAQQRGFVVYVDAQLARGSQLTLPSPSSLSPHLDFRFLDASFGGSALASYPLRTFGDWPSFVAVCAATGLNPGRRE